MDAICDDLAAEHEALDALVQRPPRRGVGRADAGARLGGARPDQPPLVLRRHRRAGRHRPRGLRARHGRACSTRWRPVSDRVRGARAARWPPAELLAGWRAGRAAPARGARARLDPNARIPWYGPAMGARSFATARLMETWAHGQDVVDALGRRAAADGAAAPRRPHRRAGPAVRLRHSTGSTLPDADVRVAARGPRRRRPWTWGPEDCRRPGRAGRARLLPRRHPAPPPSPTPRCASTGPAADRVDGHRPGLRRTAGRGPRAGSVRPPLTGATRVGAYRFAISLKSSAAAVPIRRPVLGEPLPDPPPEGLELVVVGRLHRRLELAGVRLERGELGRRRTS